MPSLEITSGDLLKGLLNLSFDVPVAILDSCGSKSLGSHKLLAGINPVRSLSLESDDAGDTLAVFDELTSDRDIASIFTISYDFGRKMLGLADLENATREPDIFIATFENLFVFDYADGSLRVEGNPSTRHTALALLEKAIFSERRFETEVGPATALSNFTEEEYIRRVEAIHAQIRAGYTYQTNLTQKYSVDLAKNATPQALFYRLRTSHPAAFSAFVSRFDDHVLSISPERFFEIEFQASNPGRISASPIKGTIRRGSDSAEDALLRKMLSESEKDRAENTMIVDLVRNDLGRICEYGTVEVERLCDIEVHPTLFHLVSTVHGLLRNGTRPSNVLEAAFPSGSITGCPKLKTMEIIDELENVPRGLSMGAIGYSGFDNRIDVNVAIRTVVVEESTASFNVGGGIVIDSDPASEYQESILKAKAIFSALNVCGQ